MNIVSFLHPAEMTVLEQRCLNLIVCLLYLLPAAVWDLRTRMIPGWYLLAGLIGGLTGRIAAMAMGKLSWQDLVLSVQPGTFLLLVSRVTGEKIGYGDGAFFVVMGLLAGWSLCLMVLMLSVLLSSVYAMVLFLRRKGNRQSRIPFLPFAAGGTAAAILMMTL